MRIKVVVPFPFVGEALARRAAQIPEGLLAPTTEVVFAPVPASTGVTDNPHDSLLMDFFTHQAGMTAEEEGFDAVCLETMSDSGLRALRCRLSIPVVGPAQSSLLLACQLGHRFSIITIWQKLIHGYERLLRDYELQAKCASLRDAGLEPTPDWMDNLMTGREEALFAKFEALAWQCIREDGADVIVFGSTTMFQAHQYLSSRLPVPVINPGAVALKTAEALVDLGLSHSKVGYPVPDEPRDDMYTRAARAVSQLPGN